MEEDSEESNDDVQGEDKPVVLWEKCIQQSIFVDLSEDESIHLSDLESSLALHLSQAESATSEVSIHLSGSSELAALDGTSSESSTVSSKSVSAAESKAKSRTKSASAQRPNAMRKELPIKQGVEDAAQNTSDEDQEDLPYDGDLGSPYFNHTAGSLGSSEGGNIGNGSPDQICLQEDTNTKPNDSSEVPPQRPVPADIKHLLLRHFSQEELLQSGRLIEAETLPEVSLLESVDDTVLSMGLTHNRSTIQSSKTESSNEKSNMASKNENSDVKTEKQMNDFTSAASNKNTSSSASSNRSSLYASKDVAEQEKTEEDIQVQRVPLVRTRSFGEIKYGQGQVHYPLPDFSKVAPKVKIPKAPSGPVRSLPQSPKAIHRAESSPGMLEVISRVLEDSVQPPEKPYVFRNSEKHPPALVHHLQIEYDKLLTKYAEAENLIDQMRLGNNPSSEAVLYSEHRDAEEIGFGERSPIKHWVSHLPAENLTKKEAEIMECTNVKEASAVSSNQHEDEPSDGERLTDELRDIVSQFMQKVEDLKFNVRNMTINTADQQMMLRSMMEAQDQLERNYINKKDEHRALEMQNYMGLSRNTGTFDPNRLVEGDIFRIGMHLEDLKEMIDKNTYEQISPPHSSSTPTSVTASLHAKPDKLPFNTPSPPSSLHEVSNASFASSSCKMDRQKEENKEAEAEAEEASEVRGGLDESSQIITAEPSMKNVGHNCISRDLVGSPEGLPFQKVEDEEGSEEERSSVLSEGRGHGDILAYLSETRSSSRQRQWTANGIPSSHDECDLGDCVSLAVEVSCSSHPPGNPDIQSDLDPPLSTSCVSQVQRIVSPETDSGFGSSYLNQSANGTFQQNLLTGSVPSQSDGLSGSDSEGSCSNLDTEVHSVHPSVQMQLCGASAVELWVESTTKEPSLRLQGSEQKLPAQLQHHVSEPVLGSTIDSVDRPLTSCSCNSEAILALQTEVSRLKKNLEEGLVQLPHLAQKMDYLTSKYREERQERRSKTRTRLTPTSSCLGKSSSRGVNNFTSSQLRIDDWISSDMDPSKSKGSDSGDGSCSEIMLEIHVSPEGSGRHGGSVHSRAEFGENLQHTTQSNRGQSHGTVGNFTLKGETDFVAEGQRHQAMDRWSLLQKPLLQVSYGSSSSLPASYKVREPQLQSYQRKRSTQSDSALLPSNVYFQRTPSPVSPFPRTASKTSRRKGRKEEDVSRTLDQAIEVARSMKRTTDRMARRLSADLAQAQLHRKLYSMQPLGGRKHQTF